MDLPTSSPRRMELLAGIRWTKSQSPRYSLGVGVVTKDKSVQCKINEKMNLNLNGLLAIRQIDNTSL